MKRKLKAKQRISRTAKIGRQCAALPVRLGSDGRLLVMLVTSRATKRWVVPKGWLAPKLSAADAAAREAYEEAGVLGWIVGDAPVGSYRYVKRLTPTSSIPCDVDVFLLEVDEELERWPERHQRETSWFTPDEAAARVEEADLGAILLGLEAMLVR